MTRARIWGATVFVDYASRWVKVNLMQDATGELTLEANNAFEGDCMGTNHPLRQMAVLFEVQTLPSPGSELAQIRLCRLNQGLFLRRKVK